MSRTAKIAGVAALAGMMMAVAILAATDDRKPSPAPHVAATADEGHDLLARELDRCATLTMPDSGCEAAWAANRRRFFHQAMPALGRPSDGDMPPDAEGVAP